MSEIKPTGWVRYQINGRFENWVYIPGYDDPTAEDDTREYIINKFESWANHAERYRMEWHYGEIPPKERIEVEIKRNRARIESIKQQIQELEHQLVT